MKDGVKIINTSRGPLIVEKDLREALDSGKVTGQQWTWYPQSLSARTILFWAQEYDYYPTYCLGSQGIQTETYGHCSG